MIVCSNVVVNMCEKHGSECYLPLQLHWYDWMFGGIFLGVVWHYFG